MTSTMVGRPNTRREVHPQAVNSQEERPRAVCSFAHTSRPVPLAEQGENQVRYPHSDVQYLGLLRGYYLAHGLPDHVNKVVAPPRDPKGLLPRVVEVNDLCRDCRRVPEDLADEIGQKLVDAADSLEELDFDWAERIRYYAKEFDAARARSQAAAA